MPLTPGYPRAALLALAFDHLGAPPACVHPGVGLGLDADWAGHVFQSKSGDDNTQ